MQLSRISSNIKFFWNTISLLLGLLLLYLTYWFSRQHPASNQAVIELAIIGLILTTLALYFLFNSKTLLFDDNHLYIKTRKSTSCIPISKLITVKLTMTSVNNVHFWKIRYYNEPGNIKTVRFIPRIYSKAFKQFLKKVKEASPLKIQTYSHSFDLDQ